MIDDLDDLIEDIFEEYEDNDTPYEEPEVIEELPAPLPYNQWCQEVSRCIEKLTLYAHNIYTVGFENWWYYWWLEGKTPTEAASMGLTEEIINEDE